MNTENLDSKRAGGAGMIDALITPALLLDESKLDRNIQRLASHISALGAVLRPHMKTAKSIDVARRIYPGEPGPITVSTLAEAEYFADYGYKDITYAVGVSPAAAVRGLELSRRTGANVKFLLDTVEQADALGDAGRKTGVVPSAFIELDVDDHRGGLKPADPNLVIVAGRVKAAGVDLVGVLSHAGESYALSTKEALVAAAENERAETVKAANVLREHGHACPIVSLGSTPTAHFAENLDGVTEVRAGVYVFFDLVQHGVGVCTLDDLAISVLATVVGAKPEKGWILVDAGWMALSRDRGTSSQKVDQGYGVVCDEQGRVYEDVIVSQASQEHGILSIRSGSSKAMPILPIGSKVRILPNHACAMAGQHDFYSVVNGKSPTIQARWNRMRGW
ncbi:alanine racemase [Phyllobacterium phragmitis]|uniref:Alanine racemase n=2 Tax=Phyllobacterium phragmitis TaxID=2670329 RepID=A0A2S9ISU2_9HYPH|nr:alanine racemase [Phyllobacterium phragmitis]PRD43592.1 alanine racemase [Phyllobacterium phragmitis]